MKNKPNHKVSPHRNRRITVLRKAGDLVLSTVCKEIEAKDLTQSFLSTIFKDMLSIVIGNRTAIGSAANQVGYDQRVIAIKDEHEPNGWLFMVNPKITDHGEEKEIQDECCLSYPGKSSKVARWKKITVSFYTINPQGVTEVRPDVDFTGLKARIIQHEIDHLNGFCKVGSGDF